METVEDIENCKSLDDIAGLIGKCERCVLYKTKTKDVPGVGSPKAEILFIGEAPGKDEDLKGEPFVGRAGQFLTEMIEMIGLKRTDVFIANTVKHRPPGNRDPYPEEKEACMPYLLKQINLIKPKLVVLLGKHAMETFLPELRISVCHGQPKRKNGQVYLPLYHPAAALYNGGLRETLINDFKKIPKIIELIKNPKNEK